MQAILNVCQAHPGEIRNIICEQCIRLQCPQCSKESHQTLKGHKNYNDFLGHTQETYEFWSFGVRVALVTSFLPKHNIKAEAGHQICGRGHQRNNFE